MLWRLQQGDVPAKHHAALRDAERLRFEHCLTREGFEGAYTILYHEHAPQQYVATPQAAAPALSGDLPTKQRRHFVTGGLTAASTPLLFNDDLTIGVVASLPSESLYVAYGDADSLYFVREGGATLRSGFGDLQVCAGDYVCVPKGVIHRFVEPTGSQRWLTIRCRAGLGIPGQWRNPVGQLRMDAPYSERDFRVPKFQGPIDEGIREVSVVTRTSHTVCSYEHSPIDVVGYDGSVVPWAFPILAFQPRVSSVHLPPTWHGTFAARGALICSFVPRPLEFGPDAVPCPYPHSSVDIDEVIYYVRGNFTSRIGIKAGSVSLHPAGIPHGPHPGRYEASIGRTHTEELAVMLDCAKPLTVTLDACAIEDQNYERSFTAS